MVCDSVSHARGKVAKLRTYGVDLETGGVMLYGNLGRDQTRLSGVDVVPVEDQNNRALIARQRSGERFRLRDELQCPLCGDRAEHRREVLASVLVEVATCGQASVSLSGIRYILSTKQ